MRGLKDIPTSRPAATQHSPNRKRRFRSSLSVANREMQKLAFLDLIRLGQTDEKASKKLKFPRETAERALARFTRYWKADPEFQQRYHEAREIYKQVAGGIIDMALPKAAQGVVEIGEKARDPKVQLQAYAMILKGRGILNEGQGVNVAVGVLVNEPPKIVEIRPNEGSQPYRELVKE